MDTARAQESGDDLTQIAAGMFKNVELLQNLKDDEVIALYANLTGQNIKYIADESWLVKSHRSYPRDWCAREITQGAIDSNKNSPASLNGVVFESTELDEGKQQFTMKEPWGFDDYELLYLFNSVKSDDVESAGGNGLGIKQASKLLMTHYGVSQITVMGNGWDFDYKNLDREAVNAFFASQGHPEIQLKGSCFCGVVNVHGIPRDETTFTVETSDAETKQALSAMPLLGVSDSNPYTNNPDFKCEHGSIQFVLPQPDQEGLPRGRVYVNGQVMSWYTGYGTPTADNWSGPLCLNVNLTNIEYDMTIDRQPMWHFELTRYVEKYLVPHMDHQQKIDLLRKCEPLWTIQGERDANPGFVQFMQTIVGSLASEGFNRAEFEATFPKAKCLVLGETAEHSRLQLDRLGERGFTILPSYFRAFGLRTVSDEMPPEAAGANGAQVRDVQRKNVEEVGISVGSFNYEGKNARQLGKELRERLKGTLGDVTLSRDNKEIQIKIPENIPAELLSHPLFSFREDNRPQNIILQMRGFIRAALHTNIAENAKITHPKGISRYSLDTDPVTRVQMLNLRTTPQDSTIQGNTITLEMAPSQARELFEALTLQPQQTRSRPHIKIDPKVALRVAAGVGALATLGFGVRAIINSYNELPKRNERASRAQFPNWRNSKSYYGKTTPGTGTETLDTLREKMTETVAVDPDLLRVNADRPTTFTLVTGLTPKRTQQLEALRNYLRIGTSLKLDEELFVFRNAPGTSTITFDGESFGIHERVMNQPFSVAVAALTHQLGVSGSNTTDHSEQADDPDTQRSIRAITTSVQQFSQQIALKQKLGTALSPQEQAFVNAVAQWDDGRGIKSIAASSTTPEVTTPINSQPILSSGQFHNVPPTGTGTVKVMRLEAPTKSAIKNWSDWKIQGAPITMTLPGDWNEGSSKSTRFGPVPGWSTVMQVTGSANLQDATAAAIRAIGRIPMRATDDGEYKAIGPMGKPSGTFDMFTNGVRTDDGKFYVVIVNPGFYTDEAIYKRIAGSLKVSANH